MNKRDEWTFRYRGKALLAATQAKIEHHDGRFVWWEKEKNTAETELREKGITIEMRERPGTRLVPDQAAFSAYAARGVPIVQLDPERQRHLQECHDKMDEHARRAQEYRVFARAFELNQDAELDLTVADIQFFGL
jgi:hypothetical protein